MKTPESVWYDQARDQIYVSNINGNPTDKDNNGFIALLHKDGTVKVLQWVAGMDAPKGMAVVGNLLYVTDIDKFHVINIDEARIIKTVKVDSALFLNDMASDNEGNIYISDMSRNHLLKYDGSKTEIWLQTDLINAPNGLSFFDNYLYSGTKDNLLKVDVSTKNVEILVKGTGPIDGLIPLGDNKFVISDWSGKITLVNPDEKLVLSNTSDEKVQAADLGFIPEEKLILIPTFFDNRVIARKLDE
jgi:sugar lactone lactonase YvrE